MTDLSRLLRTGGVLGAGLGREAVAEWLDARTLAPGERVGAYRVLREIGRGGMAIVYEAERADGEYEQHVALKWMRVADESANERLRQERQMLARLRHAHIARLIDGGRTDDGMSWFAMELIDGIPVDRWCVERGLTRAQVLDVFDQVADAVAFAHGHLLVHRDIKPWNVLVESAGGAKLLDFGIAAVRGASDAEHAYTPGWASPEQTRGAPVGIASDIYQLGLLLRQLLLGRISAAPATHAADSRCAGQDAEPTASTALPVTLAAIVATTLAEDPEARYATVAELRADLRAWREHRPTRAVRLHSAHRVGLFLRRNAWAAGIGAVALVAIVAIAAALGARLARERDLALREAQKATATREFVVSMLRTADPHIARGEHLTVRDVLSQGEARAERELAAEPELQATMLATIADVHAALGDWAQFERVNARAIELLEGLPGARLTLARRLREQARMVSARGDAATALRWVERAAAALPDADLDPELYVRLMVSRSAILDRLGRKPEADALKQRAYDVALARLGPDHVTTLYARANLIWLTVERGEMAAALAAWRESIAAMTRNPDRGAASPDTLQERVSLAEVLYADGQLAAARAEIAALLPQLERVVGPRHLGLLRALAIDARAALDLGRTEQAAATMARAAATDNLGQLGLGGRRHYVLAQALLALAQRRPAEALHDLEPMLAADAAGDAMTRVTMRLTQARAHCALGNADAAASALHEATLAAGPLGVTHPQRRRLEVIGSSCAGFEPGGAPYP